jgi:hypothetical protein
VSQSLNESAKAERQPKVIKVRHLDEAPEGGSGSDLATLLHTPAVPLPARGKLDVAKHYLTTKAYMEAYQSSYYTFVCDEGGDLEFTDECEWMEDREAAWGFIPAFNSWGERVYHIWLLEWMFLSCST